MSRPIDAAIAAAEARPAQQVWQGRVRLPSSGREVQLAVPADLTPIEVIDLVGFATTELPRQLAAASAHRSRILVPG